MLMSLREDGIKKEEMAKIICFFCRLREAMYITDAGYNVCSSCIQGRKMIENRKEIAGVG
jgi:hypothetical protein